MMLSQRHQLNRRILTRAILNAEYLATPQRRQIFHHIAAHPTETVLGGAVVLSGYRIWKLELRTREQDQAMRSLEDSLETQKQSFHEREKEMRSSSEEWQRKYSILREETKRMEASIVDRGKAGEEVLAQLLEECKVQGIVEDYQLQQEIAPGKRPDAVVEVMEDHCLVIDSKAPNPPNERNEKTRRDYADTLKRHAWQLSEKHYNNTSSEKQLAVTLMLLPGEGYLQSAYEHGKDIFGLNNYARERNVMILGPNGLRAILQATRMWLEEKAANERLKDAHVHENIAITLEPLWVQSLLPSMKQVSNLLEKVVVTWNSKVDTVVAFDEALRSKDILNLAKARKTQLPRKVTMPKKLLRDSI